MKTTRRNFPWTIVATAAVAGASFVGIASYVGGNRTMSLSAEETPIAVTDVTPKGDGQANGANNGTHQGGTAHQSGTDAAAITAGKINDAIKSGGFENARVLGIDIVDHTAIVDMNSGIVDTLGSTGEAELIETLKSALSKDKRVNNFQIRVDGEIQRTLGHSDLSAPVPVR